MSEKGSSNQKSRPEKGPGGYDIRDLMRKAQDKYREKMVPQPQHELMPDGSDEVKQVSEHSTSYLESLLKEGPVGEVCEKVDISESVPLPRKKTEYEKYMKSKEREEQVSTGKALCY